MLKRELKYLLTAVMFFSRIPVPRWVGYSEEQLNHSTRYFPMVGWFIGGIAALSLWVFHFILPTPFAILLSMIGTIYLTGAFHEDGFADFCDGYGGGYTKEKVLTIMKDSRLGTYGTVGLVTMLASKFMSLNYLSAFEIYGLYIAGHVLSRTTAVGLIYTANYVRSDDSSKAKPVGNSISTGSFIFSILITLPAFLLVGLEISALFILANSILFMLFRRYIIKKTGGYTGDVLGALQQLSELCLLLVAVSYYFSK